MSTPTDDSSKRGHQRHDTVLIHGVSTTDVQRLQEVAVAAKSRAYCPYSKFRVGAAILLPNGEIVAGANVENASSPNGTCAERVAIATAVVQGARSGDLKAIAVSSDITPGASPCGMCRQVIREFCPPSTPIVMFDKNDKPTIMTLEQLLPMSFGPDSIAALNGN